MFATQRHLVHPRERLDYFAETLSQRCGYKTSITGSIVSKKISRVLNEKKDSDHVLVASYNAIQKNTFLEYIVQLYDDHEFGYAALEYVYDHVLLPVIDYIGQQGNSEEQELVRTVLLPFALTLRMSVDGSYRATHGFLVDEGDVSTVGIAMRQFEGDVDKVMRYFSKEQREILSNYQWNGDWSCIRNLFEKTLLYYISIL